MKLSTTEDIAAPIEHVFAEASDFEAFERRALREGVKVTRQQAGPAQIGTVWDIVALFRGRNRHFTATLTALDAPDGYIVATKADGLIFLARCDLVALSPKRTRISMVIDITAQSLAARVLLQSLKLVKARLLTQFKSRMRSYATAIEENYRLRG